MPASPFALCVRYQLVSSRPLPCRLPPLDACPYPHPCPLRIPVRGRSGVGPLARHGDDVPEDERVLPDDTDEVKKAKEEKAKVLIHRAAYIVSHA